MKLTKLGHACFIAEEQGQRIIVDPGGYTDLPEDLSNIVAVVITHEHGDHFEPTRIEQIKAVNPEVQLFGSREVTAKLPGCTEPAKAMAYKAGTFSLSFYGDLHELARPGKPQIANIGVCINDLVAYPGDSYAQPGKRVKAVFAPKNAPWLHISAAYAFVSNAQADVIIPTHDALLSDIGHTVYDAHLREAAEQSGSSYQPLGIGQSIEI